MNGSNQFLSEDINKVTDSTKIQGVIFEIILRHIKDLIYVMKVEKRVFRYVFLNEMALTHAKITTEYIGKSLQELLPEKVARHLQIQYETVLKNNEPFSFQDTVVLADGRVVYGESILTPIFDHLGEIRYIVSVTRDVTESVLEKRKINETRQRYKSLVDHNMDVVFSLDTNGLLLQANPSTYNIIGFGEEELIGTSIFSLLDDEDASTFYKMFQETLKGLPQEYIGCSLINKKGKTMKVHIKSIPIMVDGNILGVYTIIKDITEKVSIEEMMKFMAYHDQLTGLPNRSSLKQELYAALEDGKEHHFQIAIMYIDLDRFKFLNDTMGHSVGDLLLKEVAERLMTIKCENYRIYRQGGDEFIVILKKANVKKASKYAEMILHSIQQVFSFKEHEFYISASIGISMFPDDGKDGDTLIKHADTALYLVKDTGKGHYRFYRSSMQQGTSQTLKLETGLRTAIERNELSLHYQPQVDLISGETKSFEVLLRWKHPNLGLISPCDFIPLAEETGLIIPIGEWVIKTVCSNLHKWKEQGYHEVSVGINLSPTQFQQPSLIQFINQTILENQINSNCLEFEITEGALKDVNEALLILSKLKEIGVKIAVDDFGTGFSSLSYLKCFPIDTLKIDQSFVKDIIHNEKDAAITTTIIHLAHSLGLTVIAEGVEHIEQVEFVREKKCHKAQGFYFSKPISENMMIQNYLSKRG